MTVGTGPNGLDVHEEIDYDGSGAGVETRDVPVWVIVLPSGGTDKLMGPSACRAPASDRAKPSSGATVLV